MSFADSSAGHIHFLMEGAPDAPVLMFAHALGADLTSWDRQAAALSSHFRVLRYDLRGHGRSCAPPGPYTIEWLARDALRLLDELAVPRVHFCGLSLGGMVGLWLAAHRADRLASLVVANAAAWIGSAQMWNARIDRARRAGMDSIADDVLERWFTPQFRSDFPHAVAAARTVLVATSAEGYAGCCAAIRDMDHRPELRLIRARTLVMAGTYDTVVTPVMSCEIARAIPNARFVELAAGHQSNIEAAEAFQCALLDFLGT